MSASTGTNGGHAKDGSRLESWKAIARYLGRDVRSVQRWERERGLPVHRIPGRKGSVFAYEGELAGWLHSDKVEAANPQASVPTHVSRTWRPSWLAGAGLLAVALTAVGFFAVLHGEWRPATAPNPGPKFLAVLPMVNLSGERAQDYFADGFTEELIATLSQIHALHVISRTSTMIYKGSRMPLPTIARKLHAKYVLEGSITRDGARVRVIAQLIDAASDTHISARTYNADVKDVLAVQGRISRAIAADVGLELSPREKSRIGRTRLIDPAAHDLYLKASYEFAQQTPDGIRASLALYQASAARAPRFALAYVGIAKAEAALAQITAQSQDESIRRERDALTRALALDPRLGEAHGLLASLAYYRDWNWPGAEREFRRALAEGAQASTEQRYGVALITRGRFYEGMEHVQTALELDPLGMSPRVSLFFALYFQRKYPEARHALDEVLAGNPNFLAGHALRGLVASLRHDCGQSTADAHWIAKHFPSPLADFEAALAATCRRQFTAARQSLAEMLHAKGAAFASPYQIALGYAAVHDNGAALMWLGKSVEIREPQALYMKVEPLFDGLRPEPGFIALERKVRL